MPVANKHMEKAERYFQKGKLEAALEEYLLAWKDEPQNDAIVITVAELYQRLNKVKESRECYVFLYDKAVERNDGQKVVELLRKMQVLGPVEPSRLIAAAQFLEKARPDLASEQYRRAMELAGEQNPELGLQCLQGMARLQPGSLDLHRKLATTAARLGNKTVAVAAYRRLAEMLTAIGKWKEAIEAFEQICLLAPKDQPAQIALAQTYLKAGQPGSVIALWKDIAEKSEDREALGLLAQAYLAEKQLEKAEALYWRLLEGSKEAANALLEIAKGYLSEGKGNSLLGLLRALDEHLTAHHPSKDLILLAEKLSQLEHTQAAVLEPLSRLLDRLHLDSPLAAALNTLFKLHLASREFPKAVDALERLIDINPYDPECAPKLEQLEGKVEASISRELASRLGISPSAGDAADSSAVTAVAVGVGQIAQGPDSGTNPLKDLMLQAEIFLQYGMQDKAKERLDRVAKLFPGEERKNEELATLFERAGFASTRPAAAPSPVAETETRDVRADLKRVSEISRNLSRQGTVKAVLFAAVNDIGRFWQVSRCVAGLATQNRPPSMAMEYIAPGIAASDAPRLGKLVMGLQQAIGGKDFPVVAENVEESPVLAGLQDTLAALQVESLVAIPLRDGDQEIGILVMEQCGQRRSWKGNDLAGLEALAEQIVMAVANVRLRNLMKALAVTDERSGLLHRDSYLTCLLSEAERMRTQKTPLSVILLQFSLPEPRSGDAKKGKEMEEFLQKFSAAVMSQLRQNDMAVKYGLQTLALILPGATGKDASSVTEKMRKLTQSTWNSGAGNPPHLIAGVAEAIREGTMDSADRITELINRLEWALEAARAGGEDAVKLLEPAVPQ
jgi:tetratricopeptide (TPR) repeat protein/GGDEF domain-containing protein